MVCVTCGGNNLTISYGSHPFDVGGLPHIMLHDVEIVHCDDCGEESLMLRRIELLHLNVACKLIMDSSMLDSEKKFLIKYIASQYAIIHQKEE